MPRGQTLVEVVVSLAIGLIVLISLVRAVVVGIRNASFAKKQALATKYAQEGMERVRAYRDQNSWEDFKNNCGNLNFPLSDSFDREIECLCFNNETQVNCNSANVNKVEVEVTVSWTDSSGTHKSELTSFFTKWNEN